MSSYVLQGDEEFNIEKAKILQQEELKISAQFAKQQKQIETKKKMWLTSCCLFFDLHSRSDYSKKLNVARLEVLEEQEQCLKVRGLLQAFLPLWLLCISGNYERRLGKVEGSRQWRDKISRSDERSSRTGLCLSHYSLGVLIMPDFSVFVSTSWAGSPCARSSIGSRSDQGWELVADLLATTYAIQGVSDEANQIFTEKSGLSCTFKYDEENFLPESRFGCIFAFFLWQGNFTFDSIGGIEVAIGDRIKVTNTLEKRLELAVQQVSSLSRFAVTFSGS